MYASEKYVRVEIKELKESINAVAADLGGDITSLYELIVQLRERVQELETQLKGLTNE